MTLRGDVIFLELVLQKTDNKLSAWQKITRFIRILGFSFSLILVLLLIGVVALYGIHRKEIPHVLAVEDYRPTLRSKVFAQNGELIAEFGVDERIVTKKGDIPVLIAKAFIASEDKNFYRHHGIDFMGVVNAILQSLSGKRSTLRGASTITQQLAKSLLVKEEGYEQATARTIARKVKEAILARRLEMHLSKEDILWIYLNEVYLGHGSYGVAAAARNYFRKNLKELSLSEIAMLAGLPQAPSRFSPQVNMNAAFVRQNYVLGRMRDDGFISGQQYNDAMTANQQLKIYDRQNSFRESAPYFAETVRRMVVDQFGQQRIYEDGLNIYTTLDLEQERHMQRVLKLGLLDIDKRQGFLGPIFSPKNDKEKTAAKNVVRQINENFSVQLGDGFYLAWVEKIDEAMDGVFINTGAQKGVIPLAGMWWARTRDPKINFASAKLSSVGHVLKIDDVILVRKRSEAEMHKLNQESVQGAKLTNLLNNIDIKKYNLFSLEQEPNVEGAMVALEPASGYVTAMNGGYSFDRSEFNRVYQACRQPGSAFKPVVFGAAIAHKKYTPATLVLDAPLTFYTSGNDNTWRPQNLSHGYKGEVTVREAVMNSMNVPTINVMADVGLGTVLDFAKQLGINTKLKAELGTSIGSSCITPFELGKVFSTIANMGEAIEPILIKEITDRDHKRLTISAKKNDPWLLRTDRIAQSINQFFGSKKNVMEKEDAYTLHYLLTEVTRHGTAQRTNALNRHIAGKTGTTNDSFDAWFVGYSRNLLSLVWVGNDMMDQPLGQYEQGGRTSLPLFIDFMDKALKNLPNQDWPMPSTMCLARIDAKTGLRITDEHPLSFVAPFRCGQEPMLMESAPKHSLEAVEVMGGM